MNKFSFKDERKYMKVSVDILMDNVLTHGDSYIHDECYNNNMSDDVEWRYNRPKSKIDFKLRMFFVSYTNLKERVKPYTKYTKQDIHLQMIRYYKENLSNFGYSIPESDYKSVVEEFYSTLKNRFPKMSVEIDMDKENTSKEKHNVI